MSFIPDAERIDEMAKVKTSRKRDLQEVIQAFANKPLMPGEYVEADDDLSLNEYNGKNVTVMSAIIIEMTKKYGMEDRVIYSSFNHYSVEKIREIDPTAQTGLLYADGTIDMPPYGNKYGVKALHPALYNLQFPGFLEECMKEGLELNVWTVNEPQYVEMCKAAHVHAVITNYPDMAMEILNQGEKL